MSVSRIASKVPAGAHAVAVLEAPELAGWRDLCAAASPATAAALGLACAERGGAHCLSATAMPGRRELNHAIGLPADRPLASVDLDAIESFFAARGLPALVAVVAGAPAQEQLAARGYAAEYAWVKFARDATPPAPVACELEVRPVAPSDASRMGRLIAGAFGLPAAAADRLSLLVGRPGWNCRGAYDGSALVGTGSLFVHGEAGWLNWAATDPAHRGRRAQKALPAARVALAARLGLRGLVTETGEQAPGVADPSHRNIRAAAFEPVYRRPFWRATAGA